MGRRENRGQARVKSLQLCRQVQRTLQLAMGCCDCEVMQSLQVVQVAPLAGAGQLIVSVAPMLPSDERPSLEVLAAIEQFNGFLRTEVAGAIRRRKAPQLFFQVVQQQ